MAPLLANVSCFFVEGAPGAGKTTLVQLISQKIPNVTTVYEPVESFTNVNGAGNILDFMFNNPNRWTFTAETYIALMHAKSVEDQVKIPNTSIMFFDRSIYADRYVFGKMALNSGNMNNIEWEIYKQIVDCIVKNITVKPHGFIYLQTTPQITLERIRSREGKDSEKNNASSLKFQKDLVMFYQEWFIEKKEIPENLAQIPVLIIDATQNFKDDAIIQQQCIDQVKKFMEKYKN